MPGIRYAARRVVFGLTKDRGEPIQAGVLAQYLRPLFGFDGSSPTIAFEESPVNITPFSLAVPETELGDLLARIRNTRWPSDVVTDWSRGVPTVYARKLADYWASDYDWRKQEAVLNGFTQFTADIDGQTIHFVHVRSAEAEATPLILLHGYPSSFVEALRMIGPLVDPVAHGGRPEDAFHVVVPSLPGFGFSTPVAASGWAIAESASAFDRIMQALRYDRYGVSGGDIGAGVAEQLCIQGGDRVIGSLVVTDPGVIATEYTPPTDHLTEAEQERHQALKAARSEDFGYLQVQSTRPQSIAYGLTDSPVAQLTWIVEKFKEWTDPGNELPEDAVDLDQLLTLVSVYWFGKGGAGAANFLYEAAHAAAAWGQTHDRPQGFVAFGDEALIRRILDPGETLTYWNQHPHGGHFPAMEVPDLLVGDLRAFFGALRP
jgi:pimeloyl-ACP methyl ester carboxylesterase